MKKTVTAYDENGEYHRISLPKPTIETGYIRYENGVRIEAIYVSPRAKRCVIETDSIWDNGHGECAGTRYSLVTDESRLARLANEWPEVGEALEKSGMLTIEEL